MINENASRSNRHTIYLAKSGAGKSQALKQNKEIPAKGARVFLWDTNNDHKANRFRTKEAYLKATIKAIASKKGFRLAFTGGGDSGDIIKDYEWWCSVVLAALDGNHETFIIVEELAAVSPSAHKATKNAAIMMNQSRKYGGIFHGTSQRPEEVAKTFTDNCEVVYIGQQKTHNANKYSKKFGIPEEKIKQLNPLEFYVSDDAKPEDFYFLKLKYKK